jgi:hypothetical protein
MRAAVLAFAALAACAEVPPQPLPMPPADGQPIEMVLGAEKFQVNLSPRTDAAGGVVLRVYRTNGKALDYSEGLTAKRVAEAFCASRNRALNPAAYGMFQATGAWVYEGGCS